MSPNSIKERMFNANAITCLLYLVSMCSGFPYTVVSGERNRGPVVKLFKTIGQQQCVRECRHRPKLCRGVNYRKQKLLCELVSVVNETEPNPDYVRIKPDQTGNDSTDCMPCTKEDLCATLTSQKVHCIRDNDDPIDCTSLHEQDYNSSSGIYQVKIPVLGYVNVFCDMETDGGGWTVIQRRHDGTEDFDRTWMEYKNGFGDLTSEFWFGNDKLHYLLSQGVYELSMDMEDFDNQTRYVKYTSFNVGDETTKYIANISGYSGDVDDCFTGKLKPINNMMFSTWDQDNDVAASHCAKLYKSGWWHSDCHCANPNGLYLKGYNSQTARGITYESWRSQDYSLKYVHLMVRRTD